MCTEAHHDHLRASGLSGARNVRRVVNLGEPMILGECDRCPSSRPSTLAVPAVAGPFSVSMFAGDFESLPLRAHVLFGEVPAYPAAGDFELAVSVAFRCDDAAAEWRVEAVRFRRVNPGHPLDERALKMIAVATAARLFRAAGVGQ